MKLFVDDFRSIPSQDWTLAKTNTDAIRILHNFKVEIISLDHDIFFTIPDNKMVQGYISEECFKPVAYYLALMKEKPRVLFHTGNIGAGQVMAEIIGVKFEWWVPGESESI